MFNRKVLKQRAKFVLSRSYFTAVGACAIASLLGGGISFGGTGLNFNGSEMAQSGGIIQNNFMAATTLFIVVFTIALVFAASIFLSAPIKVGLKNFMLRMADGDARTDNLFTAFKTRYLNIVRVSFVKNLYIFLWSLLGLIPIVLGEVFFGIFDEVFSLLTMQNPTVSDIMSLSFMIYGVFAICLIFAIPAYIKTFQYALVDYILAEEPGISARDALYRSKELMVGNKWAYVKLAISFLPWYLITPFVCCGLGSIFLAPYIEQTFAQMYLEISGRGKDYSGFEFGNNTTFRGFGF